MSKPKETGVSRAIAKRRHNAARKKRRGVYRGSSNPLRERPEIAAVMVRDLFDRFGSGGELRIGEATHAATDALRLAGVKATNSTVAQLVSYAVGCGLLRPTNSGYLLTRRVEAECTLQAANSLRAKQAA